MLFMKGTPEAPRCGFSKKVVEVLERAALPFGTFDILSDEEVRQGLKEYSQWPTYPQLYAGGELLGGCDVVLELDAEGKLKETIQDALKEVDNAGGLVPGGTHATSLTALEDAAASRGESLPGPGHAPLSPESLRKRVVELTTRSPVMLFMKGTPEEPRCGFSRKVVDALQRSGVPFSSFDILGDEGVRQDLKQLSQWPTYPQLYAGGELLGGCDIVLEMEQGGVLKPTLEEAIAKSGGSS
eukprot:jgi/Botrbrau1/7396/Bobra.0316s0037.1